MNRFLNPDNAEGNNQLSDIFKEICENGFGSKKPINFFTALGERPDILKAVWNLTQAIILEGELPSTLKQLIILVVSESNNCNYCKITHTRALENLGVPSSVIENCILDLENAPAISKAHKKALIFARNAAKNPLKLKDEEFRELKELGFNNAQIIEIAMLIAFAQFTNSWAGISGIEIDNV